MRVGAALDIQGENRTARPLVVLQAHWALARSYSEDLTKSKRRQT